jgi:hypothetical protein
MVVYKRFPYKSLRTAAVVLGAHVQCVAGGLQSVILTSCKNYILILLSLCLVMVVYKRFPYKSLRTAGCRDANVQCVARGLQSVILTWHGVYSQ